MTRRLPIALTLILVAVAIAWPARAAAQGWTIPQDLGAIGDVSNSALASNDRGDAVVAFSDGYGILVARARAHRPFSAPQRIAANGRRPGVAIDDRGVVLLAFSYGDGTHEASDVRDDDCCAGVKVSIWRPGHRPTRPRAVRRRGIGTQLGAVAATRGHRGVLVVGDEYSPNADDAVRLAPVRIDGRVGALRKVAEPGWIPMTLQWARGRAIAGLVRTSARRGTELAVARQRRSLGFAAPHRFVRLGGQLFVSAYDSDLREVVMTPDGHGGQIALYRRGRTPKLRVDLSRKPLEGRVRISTITRGPATGLKLVAPARARDGWIAVAWARRGSAPAFRETAYATTRSPAGRLTTTALPATAELIQSLAVGVAPGGAGAVGAGGIVPLVGTQGRIVALAGGRPQPAAALQIGPVMTASTSIFLTGNARDPARAVYELGGRALATTLRVTG